MVVCLCILSCGFVPPLHGYPMVGERRQLNGNNLQFYGGSPVNNNLRAQQPYSLDRTGAPLHLPPAVLSQSSQYRYDNRRGDYDGGYYFSSYRPTEDNEDLHDEELLRRSDKFKPEFKWASLENLGKAVKQAKQYGPLVFKLIKNVGMIIVWWENDPLSYFIGLVKIGVCIGGFLYW